MEKLAALMLRLTALALDLEEHFSTTRLTGTSPRCA